MPRADRSLKLLGKHAAGARPADGTRCTESFVIRSGAEVPGRIDLCTRWSRLSYEAIWSRSSRWRSSTPPACSPPQMPRRSSPGSCMPGPADLTQASPRRCGRFPRRRERAIERRSEWPGAKAEAHTIRYPNGDVTHCFALLFLARRWRGEPEPNREEANRGGFLRFAGASTANPRSHAPGIEPARPLPTIRHFPSSLKAGPDGSPSRRG